MRLGCSVYLSDLVVCSRYKYAVKLISIDTLYEAKRKILLYFVKYLAHCKLLVVQLNCRLCAMYEFFFFAVGRSREN
jgi:hypothetical protein